MEKHQGGRIQQSIISARYYGNLPLYGAAGVSVQKLLSQRSKMQVNISFNAIQSVIDTITARIGETKPKPYFLTSGGDYKAQRKAKRLNWFIEGTFYETRQYDLGLQCFRDGGIWGDGFEHVYPDWQTKRVCHERVMESEIWWMRRRPNTARHAPSSASRRWTGTSSPPSSRSGATSS